MPTVSVVRDELFRALGREYTDEEFDHLCFEYGIELDDVTSDLEIARKEHGGEKIPAGDLSEEVLYKIEVPANRYDLLCLEGIARALRIFLEKEATPEFTVKPVTPDTPVMTVQPETGYLKCWFGFVRDGPATSQAVRPYVVCAILRNIRFTPETYKSFIDMQDKLHQNLCRRRTLVAIGTHDLDTLTPPFTYEALAPEDISFVPLGQEREFRADELMEFYRTDPSVKHIKPYVGIIADKPRYPVFFDQNRTLLSLPPIINGEHSKIKMDTTNVFIECTATDLTKAHIVLNMMVTMFSEHCDPQFTVEPVKVEYQNPEQSAGYVTPDLSVREMRASMAQINGTAGISISPEEAAHLATKMQLQAYADGDGITCRVPATRSDILHAMDIVEDVAIAYGYNRIATTLPQRMTVGREQPVNQLTDMLREEVAQAGYTECLTSVLCSREDNFQNLRREDDGSAVGVANPKAKEFELVRTTLLAGLLRALQHNRDLSFKGGIKVFEISDVVIPDPESDVGASNQRTLGAVYTGPTAGFEVIHGLVDRIMLLLEVPRKSSALGDSSPIGRGRYRYFIEAADSAYEMPHIHPWWATIQNKKK